MLAKLARRARANLNLNTSRHILRAGCLSDCAFSRSIKEALNDQSKASEITIAFGTCREKKRRAFVMRNHAREFESAIWPAACPVLCPPKNDDQYRCQDHQQVVKVEFKRRVSPMEAHELIDQNHPLLIGKFLGREACHENGEAGNRAQ